MIDYRDVSMAGADLLQLIDDGKRRKTLDNFLLQQAPLVEQAMREQVEELIDSINAQVGEHYIIRLVHEDGANVVEVLEANDA